MNLPNSSYKDVYMFTCRVEIIVDAYQIHLIWIYNGSKQGISRFLHGKEYHSIENQAPR